MKICITGKPGVGKTYALKYLKSLGCNVFETDKYVVEIYRKNNVGYKLIKKVFGSKFVNNQAVDRKKLGQMVFTQPKMLIKLSNLINPIIAKKIKSLDSKKTWFIELGTYLYYSKFFSNFFDRIILIFNSKNAQNIIKNNKFLYLKKIPTFFVENSKKSKSSLYYIENKINKKSSINVDYIVDNCSTKNFFKKNLVKFLTLTN